MTDSVGAKQCMATHRLRALHRAPACRHDALPAGAPWWAIVRLAAVTWRVTTCNWLFTNELRAQQPNAVFGESRSSNLSC